MAERTVPNYIVREKINISSAIDLDIENPSDNAEFNGKNAYQVGNIVFFFISLKNVTLSVANNWRKILSINNSLYRPSTNTMLTACYGDTNFIGCILGSDGKLYLSSQNTFTGKYVNIFGSYPM